MKSVTSLLEFSLFIITFGVFLFLFNIFVIGPFLPNSQSLIIDEQRDVISKVGFYGVVFFAPIIEELFFRWPYLLLVSRFGKHWRLALVISLLFSLLHPAQAMLFAFIFSLFLCFLVVKSQSIKLSIFAHMVNNFFTLTMVMYYSGAVEKISSASNHSLLFFGALFGTIALMITWLITGRLNTLIRQNEETLLFLQNRFLSVFRCVNNKISS